VPGFCVFRMENGNAVFFKVSGALDLPFLLTVGFQELFHFFTEKVYTPLAGIGGKHPLLPEQEKSVPAHFQKAHGFF